MGESIRNVALAEGKISVGLTWDQALPIFRTGEQAADPVWHTPNRFSYQVRWTNVYTFTFERPVVRPGPYRIVEITCDALPAAPGSA